jgi:hypothetical protein
VPARLIGEYVETRIGVEEIEVWYADTLVQRMPWLRGQNKHQIDYRHIIGWLVRKPGAFARYVYHADLYPTATFRRAYDALQSQDRARADKDSGKTHCLAAVAQELIRLGRRVWFTTCSLLVQDLLGPSATTRSRRC